MNGFRFTIGVILMVIAVGMYFYIDDIKDKSGFFGVTPAQVVQMCDAGWGDVFNFTTQCMKAQLFFYSPWLSGIVGIIFLAKAGPYRGYYGAGGAGSHNRRIWLRQKTKKRLVVVISVCAVIVVGIFLYANYDITIALSPR